MSRFLAYPIAVAAIFPTAVCVLFLWIGYARLADGNREGSLFVPMLFLFTPLILGVSLASNLLAVFAGHLVAAGAPASAGAVTLATAGALVVLGCLWTQRGGPGLRRGNPVSVVPIGLFAATDVLILAGGLALLPGRPIL